MGLGTFSHRSSSLLSSKAVEKLWLGEYREQQKVSAHYHRPTWAPWYWRAECRLEGNTFFVQLSADIMERADCRIDSIPFRLEIPFNVVILPAGAYTVDVNGVSTNLDPRAQPTNIDAYNTKTLLRLEQMQGMEMLPNIATLDKPAQSIQVNQS